MAVSRGLEQDYTWAIPLSHFWPCGQGFGRFSGRIMRRTCMIAPSSEKEPSMPREFATPLLAIVCEDNTPRVLGRFNDISDVLDRFFELSMEFDTPSSRMFIIELGDASHPVTQLPAEALPEGCVR